MVASLPHLTLKLANPRGFCAGVVRAIEIVEQALVKFGKPVYVRHEIVHNRHVVQALEQKGAIFIDDLAEVDPDCPVIFSAHGVAKSVPQDAEARNLLWLDATCPLVSKVHREVERHHDQQRHIILIGHRGHPEVEGTMGQLPEGAMTLIEHVHDVEAFDPSPEMIKKGFAYATQTTLSVSDTADIITALKAKFPDINGPKHEDICYATTNRQQAVVRLAEQSDCVFVVGAPNSSNSMRLVDVARQAGCSHARLIRQFDEIDWDWLFEKKIKVMGLSAGASAPENLVQEVIDACHQRYNLTIEELEGPDETVSFKLPLALA